MYTPKHFQNQNTDEIKDFIRHNGFGIIVSQTEGKLLATHIPLELSEDGTKLVGHLSKANPQWKSFSDSSEVLTIFNGPHTYISSSWYNHENVPTWNYVAAHIYGEIKIIEGDKLYESLKKLMSHYEQRSANPVRLESLSDNYVKHAIQGIVGFEIHITKIEASYKLSQNRDDVNHSNIIHELEKRNDENSSLLAKAMTKNRCPI